MLTNHAYVIPCYRDNSDNLHVLVCKKRIFNKDGLKTLSDRLQRDAAHFSDAYSVRSIENIYYEGRNLSGAINNRAGYLSIIGGASSGDEAKQAVDAAREFKEETGGLNIKPENLLIADTLTGVKQNGLAWKGTYFVLPLDELGAQSILEKFKPNSEVDEIISISISELNHVHQKGYRYATNEYSNAFSFSNVEKDLGSSFCGGRDDFRSGFIRFVADVTKDPVEYSESLEPVISKAQNDTDKNFALWVKKNADLFGGEQTDADRVKKIKQIFKGAVKKKSSISDVAQSLFHYPSKKQVATTALDSSNPFENLSSRKNKCK